MNEIIKSLANFFESNGINATKNEMFSALILGLKDAYNLSTEEALNVVLGDNTYEKIVNHLYEKFTKVV
jgi:hypothetical protein